MSDKPTSPPKTHCMVVFAHYPAGETRVQRQAEALVEHGFEVDILCLRALDDNEAAKEIVNNIHVYRLPATRAYGHTNFFKQFLEYLIFFIEAMIALIFLHPRRRYGVVQVHNLPDFLIFSAWFPKLFGAKLILDLHDLMPEFYASRTGRSLNNWFVRLIVWQEQLSCFFADHVVTVTELWRQALTQRGVRAEKVSVVMNVADNRFFYRDLRAAVSRVDNGFHLFYHGAVVPRYGLDLVIQAVDRLKEQIPSLRFTIHGNSQYRQRLVQLVDRLELNDYVHFSAGLLPLPELAKLICNADVALVPNRRNIFTDGILPTKLMEYTALGIPTITARTPAIEAYFDDTMTEFFTAGDVEDLSRSILNLYQNPSRREAIVRNSQTFVDSYNWQKLSEDYVALVERLK